MTARTSNRESVSVLQASAAILAYSSSSPRPPARRQAALPAEYAQMHFELAATYLELGLPQDAVREWTLASEHPAYHDVCLSLAQQWQHDGGGRPRLALVEDLTDEDLEDAVEEDLLEIELDSAFEDVFDLS